MAECEKKEQRQSSKAVISIRIVHIDYYNHPLHTYSSSTPFQAARLTNASPQTSSKLPVIRIFGTTPAAQQCCLHLHALRPYLHIPAPPLSPKSLYNYAVSLRTTLESILRTAFAPSTDADRTSMANAAGNDRRDDDAAFIADIEPVMATSIYGYHPNATIFLKVSTFAPVTVTRIATLLAHRALPPPFDSLTLPHSSHIPFILQFLTDYSLSGMDYIHLTNCKFRIPLPDPISPQAASLPDHQSLLTIPPHHRRFTSRLQESSPNLFWPFLVAKRSTSPLELDAFADDIANVRCSPTPSAGDDRLNFVNRSLFLLWEEERLRTGVLPSRIVQPSRPVTAGAKLTPPFVREHLHQLLHSPSQQSQEPGALQQDLSAAVSPPPQPQAEEGLSTAYRNTNGSDEEASLSAVLRYIDASVPFDQPGDAARDIALEDDDDNEDDENDHIAQTWRDIAECTPLTDQKQSRKRPLPTRPRTIGTIMESPSHFSIPSIPSQETPHTPYTPHTAPISSFRRTQSPFVSQRPFRLMRPASRPPTISSLTDDNDKTSAMIEWTTPFYSTPSDYAAGITYGGVTLSIRKPGADGFPAFADAFPVLAPPVHILSRFITPIKKPPTLSQLRLAAISAASHEQRKGQAKNTQHAIDSMGRQVSVRSSRTTHELTLTPDMIASESEHRHDNDDVFDLLLQSDSQNDDLTSSASSEELPPLVKLSLRSSSVDREHDDEMLTNRPLSPKYDEGYQITANPSTKSRSETPSQRQRHSGQRRQSGTSPSTRFEKPNSMVSLSQSPHRYQNLSVMSLEILAKSYADRLPDPSQNEILVVCTVLKVDDSVTQPEDSTCIIMAVRPPPSLRAMFSVVSFDSEFLLLDGLAAHIRSSDPDVIVGFESQASSIGYVMERAQTIGHAFSQLASRWLKGGGHFDNAFNMPAKPNDEAAAKYFRRKGADVKITGRHIISLWRIVRTEVKLSAYSREVVAGELFNTTFPKHTNDVLEGWYSGLHSDHAARYIVRMATLNIAIVDKLNVLSRTGELARVYGIDFMSVLTRGSQFRVESMMRRVSRTRGFLLLAAAREEVFQQPAVEALPLVMEPESALYVDPVIVLDFQSLYPSVIIAHNLCFSTMLGNVNRIGSWDEIRRIGVMPAYKPPGVDSLHGLDGVENHVFTVSNGEMFVDASIRRGILPQLLEEILDTRVMVKAAMKRIVNDDATASLLNARQFGLKMIANVTYGYTSASFSGRMPCAGLADAIVQCARDSLEEICGYVDGELQEETGSRVVYGDTDSLFVQVPGATKEEAFKIGERIVARVAQTFPAPITLKLEKVYQPCVLQTKKRYVGYCYESPKQIVPTFDAKGIETVRRDTCQLVQKALERAIRLLFETKDLSIVKRDLHRLCKRVHTDRIPFADYIFRREVRLGSYKEGHLPPAAIVATKAIEHDARSAPRHGERVPFVVVYDRPGAPLKDCVISPESFLSLADSSGMRLNTTYYITKQLLPALDRILSLVGVRAATWYADFPRAAFVNSFHAKRMPAAARAADGMSRKGRQSVLPMFYAASSCAICRKRSRAAICKDCSGDEASLQMARYTLEARRRMLEARGARVMTQCRQCSQVEQDSAIGCCNVACATFNKMRVTTRALQIVDEVLNDAIWQLP